MKTLSITLLALLSILLIGNGNAWSQELINPKTPDGFQNPESQRIALNSSNTSFTVPKGKNLYITQMTVFPSSVMDNNTNFKIDGKVVYTFNYGTEVCSPKGLNKYLDTPLIIGEGTELTLDGKGELFLETFTVDAKVKPLVITEGQSLTIPSGKTFVLLHTIRMSSCNVAYKGEYKFSEIDDLHFPEFFKDVAELKKEIPQYTAIFGYIY